MFAYFNDLGDRETLADRVKRERVIGDVLILPAGRGHHILYLDADVESAGDSAAVPNLAEDNVVMEFHHHLLTAADPLAEGGSQAGARDVQDGAVDRLAGARQDLELSGVLGGVAGFPPAL